MITQHQQIKSKPFSKDVRAKLYPNGEVAIYLQKKYTPEPVKGPVEPADKTWFNLVMACIKLDPKQGQKFLAALGLSQVRNFDKPALVDSEGNPGNKREGIRYGRKGITRFGARRVRCACHLLQKEAGKHRLVFATVTIPPMPMEDISCLQERWNEVVNTYRRKLTRALRDDNLSGELVTVTEIQEKRYERTGVPYLHLHSVFVGKNRSGRWAISTEAHDQMWRETLSVVLSHPVGELNSACNLQRVKKSAEGYLGKYMTKGSKVVSRMMEDGFKGWVPGQWWSCSRSLAQRIDYETRDISDIAEWLNAVCDEVGGNVWLWHRDIYLESEIGLPIRIARYGRLNIRITAQIQTAYPPQQFSQMADRHPEISVV